jgi:hypothetical protein
MSSRKPPPINFRTTVRRAAEDANVPLDDWERAQILGQIAGLLAAHPKVGGKVAFKGGAVMHLIDGSPRLSRDLDGALISGGKVTETMIREALSTPAARKVVIRVDKLISEGPHSITFPVIACHPLSGKGEIALQLSINWSAPLILRPERQRVHIGNQDVAFLVVAKPERQAEKIRAFLKRGRPVDAYDLYFSGPRLTPAHRRGLPGLLAQKLREDPDIPSDRDLRLLFDGQVKHARERWDQEPIKVMRGRPTWAAVEPHVLAFRQYIPLRKSSKR